MLMQELQDKYKDCDKCKSCQNKVKVFGKGNPTARIAVVGEGPGREEVNQLTPFVGPAGQLLDKVLGSINLKREDIYFTNAILCRTDDRNRTPCREECLNCRERLSEELAIIKPKYTILTGSTALKSIMGEGYGVMNSHGKWFTLMSKPCYFYFCMLHPSWALHASTDGEAANKRRTLWKDIVKFQEELPVFEELTKDWENK